MAEDTRKRKISFSSEYPYERWFGTEILDHKPSSIRMDFMKSGRAPLLMGHDQRLVIGVIESVSIDSKDKMGRAEVRFSRSDFAEEKLRDVDDGILVNVSTGYRVHEMVLEKQSDAGDTYRITDWEPLEASLVGIPADPSVGVGRQASPNELEVRSPHIEQVDTPPPQGKGKTMTQEKDPAADPNAATKVTAIEAEKQRREAIINLCKANRIDSRVEARWIQDGAALETVAKEILDVMEERCKQRPTGAAELGLSRSDTQKYSILRAMRVLRWGHLDPKFRSEAAFELECSAAVGKKLNRGDGASSILIPTDVLSRPIDPAIANRAMATTPGSKGGYMVNVENMGFIDILRNRSVAMRWAARTALGPRRQRDVPAPDRQGRR
jgi:hypothetical protein